MDEYTAASIAAREWYLARLRHIDAELAGPTPDYYELVAARALLMKAVRDEAKEVMSNDALSTGT